MRDLGEKMLLLRILAAGALLLILLWSVLVPPAQAQAPILATDLLRRAQSPMLDYRWTMAPEAALEPALFRALAADAATDEAAARRAAASDAAQARKGGYPMRPHYRADRWTATAETPGLIALSAEREVYTGGAHGNRAFLSALFDRRTGARIGFARLFADPKAAYAALAPGWCSGLAEARKARRQGVALDGFEDCPPLAERTVVPVGQGWVHGFRVLVEPYVAGPYAEGSYEVMLDPTPAMGHLKPAFAKDFRQP